MGLELTLSPTEIFIFLLVYTDSKCNICVSGEKQGGRWSRTATEVVVEKGAWLTYKENPSSPTSALPIQVKQ